MNQRMQASAPYKRPSRIIGRFCAFACIAGLGLGGAAAADELDPTQATLAYLSVREWVSTFDPPPFDDPAAAIPVDGAEAACVIIRLRGRVLGSATETRPGPLMLRRATGRALAAVLGDRTVSALPENLRTDIADRLTLEIEFAGTPRPLPGRSFDSLIAQLDPGLDGIALRHGTTWRYQFPSEALQSGTAGDQSRRLIGMALDLGLPVTFEDLAVTGARFYRFRTVHLAQRAPGRSPMLLYRGSVVVPGPLDDDTIASTTGQLVDHIIASLVGEPKGLGLAGTYRPAADDYQPLMARPRDQALAALALARLAALTTAQPAQASRLRDAGRVILEELRVVIEGEDDPLANRGSCAAIVLAGLALGEASDEPTQLWLDAAARTLRESAGPTGTVTDADGERTGTVNQALAAAALTHLARLEPTLRPLAQLVVARAWDAVDPPNHVTLLPWIAWAEDDLAALGTPRPGGQANLDQIAAVLGKAQYTGDSTMPDADLEGGFELGGRPDAQSARPLAFLATRVDAGAVEADAIRRAARFLCQLSVRDADLWAYTNPPRAIGGIRQATWDHDMPMAVQATALLALTEAMRALGIEPGV